MLCLKETWSLWNKGWEQGREEGLEPVRFYPSANGADWPGYFSDLPFNDVRT